MCSGRYSPAPNFNISTKQTDEINAKTQRSRGAKGKNYEASLRAPSCLGAFALSIPGRRGLQMRQAVEHHVGNKQERGEQHRKSQRTGIGQRTGGPMADATR